MEDVDRRDVDVYRLSWVADYNDPYTFLQYLKSDWHQPAALPGRL